MRRGMLFAAALLSSTAALAETEVKLTVGDRTLTAVFADNATARALLAKFPITLPMRDLYGRELVYRFAEPLPSDAEGPRSYRVGEIAYWPPRHSFVIFYAQNGEIIDDLQPVGRITGAIEWLRQAGDVEIEFSR